MDPFLAVGTILAVLFVCFPLFNFDFDFFLSLSLLSFVDNFSSIAGNSPDDEESPN